MADEIDIEEHDVMDNPTIKDIFPDISVVKKEIDYGTEDFSEKHKEPDEAAAIDCLNVPLPIKVETTVSLNGLTQGSVSPSPNVIILGSKPSKAIKSPDVIVQIPERRGGELVVRLQCVSERLRKSERFCKDCKRFFFSKVEYAAHRRREHSRVLTVDLESWERLECYVCEKPFKTKKSLSAHYKNIHKCQFVVKGLEPKADGAIDKGSSVKSAPKPLSKKSPSINALNRAPSNNAVLAKNVHKMTAKPKNLKRPLDVTDDKSQPAKKVAKTKNETHTNKPSTRQDKLSENICNHCNANFSSKESLIKHMYDILSKTYSCEHCVEKFATKEQLNAHSATHKPVDEGSQQNNDLDVNDDVNDNDYINDNSNDINDDDDNASDDSDDFRKFYRCHLCSFYFTRRLFAENHLKRIHNKRAPFKLKLCSFDPKCVYCNRPYNDRFLYNQHINNTHMKKTQLNHTSKVKNNGSLLKSASTQRNVLIPKSIIYKCRNCPRHCLNQTTLNGHMASKLCHLTNTENKCNKCQRSIMSSSVEAHRKQHLFGNEFRTIVLTNSEDGKRILSNCPKCAVHYTDFWFWKHYVKCGSEQSNSFYCKKCDVLIDKTVKTNHELQHSAEGEFIFVDYDVDNDEENELEVEPQEDSSDDEPIMTKTRSVRTRLTYCRHCGTFIEFQRDSMEKHLSKMCARYIVPAICNLCGLMIPKALHAKHRAMHDFDADLKLKDFEFFDMTPTMKEVRVNPPPPKFPYCRHCRAYYKRRGQSAEHVKCNKPEVITCHVCQKMFTPRAYALHKTFHEYADMNPGLKQAEVGTELIYDPENITFWVCNNCDLCLPRELDIKRHLCSSSTARVICKPCNLELTVKFMRKHKQLHEKVPEMNKSMITFKRFGKRGVPCEQAEQFVRVKKPKKVHPKKGPLVYEIVFKADDEKNDAQVVKGEKAAEVGGKYETEAKDDKKAIPQKYGKSYAINNEENFKREDENAKTKEKKKTIQDAIMFEDTDESETERESDNYVIYQCYKCGYNFCDESATRNHECTKPTAYRCIACKLNFNSQEYATHLLNHTKRKDYLKQNITITSFGKTTDRREGVDKATLFKCKCGLHFLTKVGAETHVRSCNPRSKSARQKCTKCSLVFMPEVLFNHLVTHHSKNRQFEYDIKTVSLIDFKSKLHLCSKCKIVFVERQVCEEHYRECDGTSSMAEYCVVCRLPFHLTCAEFHTKQHIDDKLQDEDFAVVECGKSDKPFYITKFDNVVYKCEDCNLYSTTEYYMNRHVEGLHMNDEAVACEMCSKRFLAKSYPMHKYLHHDMNVCDELIIESLPYYNDDGCVVYELSKPQSLTDDILHCYTNTLHQCSQCKVNFITKEALENHMTMNKHRVNAKYENCTECNLLFITSAMAMHKFVHHMKMDLNRDSFVIETDLGDVIETETVEAVPILYKCVACNVHFMSLDKFQEHMTRPHVPPANVASCKECGLNFVKWGLRKHEYLHHTKHKLSLKDIAIVDPETVDNEQTTRRFGDNRDSIKTVDTNGISIGDNAETSSSLDVVSNSKECNNISAIDDDQINGNDEDQTDVEMIVDQAN